MQAITIFLRPGKNKWRGSSSNLACTVCKRTKLILSSCTVYMVKKVHCKLNLNWHQLRYIFTKSYVLPKLLLIEIKIHIFSGMKQEGHTFSALLALKNHRWRWCYLKFNIFKRTGTWLLRLKLNRAYQNFIISAWNNVCFHWMC